MDMNCVLSAAYESAETIHAFIGVGMGIAIYLLGVVCLLIIDISTRACSEL